LKWDTWTELERIDVKIKPPIPIPFASSQVHHIYDIDVAESAIFVDEFEKFLPFINDCDAIVGHNIEYDESMFRLELKRLEREYDYRPQQSICTMYSSREHCQLAKKMPWSNGYKLPKLWELYKKLFWEYFVGAHDAMVDVEATVKCFVELVKLWVIRVEEKKSVTMTLF
jgi:DNA polymerase III epsilon subunit-like protein